MKQAFVTSIVITFSPHGTAALTQPSVTARSQMADDLLGIQQLIPDQIEFSGIIHHNALSNTVYQSVKGKADPSCPSTSSAVTCQCW